ncbi:alpha/beta fold hydrolase [Prescottella equi]
MLIVAAVAISTAFHWWQTPRDKQAIEQLIGPQHRYVDVDGHRMSVAVQGSGPRTIVLMPGLATPEPIIGFGPLAQRLAEQNTVVTVEPFGTGLSDGTDAPRTSEVIVDETRSAVAESGFDGPYVLIPHSVSGLYAMWWTTHYPDEVAAVVGLDDERYTTDAAHGSPDWPSWMSIVNAAGGTRDLIALDKSTDYLGLVADYRESLGDAAEFTSEQQDLYLRAYSWVLNPTVLDEMARGAQNVQAAEGAVFPSTLPALSFLASSSPCRSSPPPHSKWSRSGSPRTAPRSATRRSSGSRSWTVTTISSTPTRRRLPSRHRGSSTSTSRRADLVDA